MPLCKVYQEVLPYMSKLIKNYSFNLCYQIFILIVPIVTAPYLARTIGSDGLGIYAYIVNVTNIITTISLCGIYNYGCREVAYKNSSIDERSKLFWEIMSLRLLLLFLATIIFIFFAIDDVNKYYFWCFYPWLIANCLDCTWFQVGIEDMKPVVLKNFFAKLASLGLIFILVKTASDTSKYIIIMSLTVLIANLIVYSDLRGKVCFIKPQIKAMEYHIINSCKLFLPQIAVIIFTQINKVLIMHFTFNSSEVAYYDLAEKILQISMSFITAVNVVMMPRMANEFALNNQENIKKYLYNSGVFSLFLAIPLFVGTNIIAKDFVIWYLGESWLPVVDLMHILSPIIIINSLLYLLSQQYLVAVNKVQILSISSYTGLILNIICSYFLINNFMGIGAAISFVVSSLLMLIMQFYAVNKTIPLFQIFLLSKNYFIGATVMGLSSLVLNYFFDIHILLLVFVLISIYFVILFLLKDKMILAMCQFFQQKE